MLWRSVTQQVTTAAGGLWSTSYPGPSPAPAPCALGVYGCMGERLSQGRFQARSPVSIPCPQRSSARRTLRQLTAPDPQVPAEAAWTREPRASSRMHRLMVLCGSFVKQPPPLGSFHRGTLRWTEGVAREGTLEVASWGSAVRSSMSNSGFVHRLSS